MRKLLVVLVSFLAGVAVGVPGTVLALGHARSGVNSGSLDQQRAFAIDDPGVKQTSSREWKNVKGLNGLVVCAKNEVAVNLTVVLLSNEDFRVLIDGTQLRPARLSAGQFDVVSGTFVGTVSPIGGSDDHTIDLQWRSTSPNLALWLSRAVLNVQYEQGTTCT